MKYGWYKQVHWGNGRLKITHEKYIYSIQAKFIVAKVKIYGKFCKFLKILYELGNYHKNKAFILFYNFY